MIINYLFLYLLNDLLTMIKLQNVKKNDYLINDLIEIYKPYIRKIANKLTDNEYLRDELYSVGLESVWKSDTKYITGLSSYHQFISYNIKYSILNLMRDYNKFQTIELTEKNITRGEDEPELDIELLNRLISLLNADERNLINQYYFEGLTMKEIGIRRGCTKQNVSKRIKNILGRIRDKKTD